MIALLAQSGRNLDVIALWIAGGALLVSIWALCYARVSARSASKMANIEQERHDREKADREAAEQRSAEAERTKWLNRHQATVKVSLEAEELVLTNYGPGKATLQRVRIGEEKTCVDIEQSNNLLHAKGWQVAGFELKKLESMSWRYEPVMGAPKDQYFPTWITVDWKDEAGRQRSLRERVDSRSKGWASI